MIVPGWGYLHTPADTHTWRRRAAVDRIRRAFFAPVPGGLDPVPRYGFWRLASFPLRAWNGKRETATTRHPAPVGWRWFKEEDRNLAWLMPAWLYYPVQAWRYRWWAVEPLIRAGLLALTEGDYWHNARLRCPSWLWCFLHDTDRDLRPVLR